MNDVRGLKLLQTLRPRIFHHYPGAALIFDERLRLDLFTAIAPDLLTDIKPKTDRLRNSFGVPSNGRFVASKIFRERARLFQGCELLIGEAGFLGFAGIPDLVGRSFRSCGLSHLMVRQGNYSMPPDRKAK